MKVKIKSFPYPVLSEQSANYIDSSFSAEITEYKANGKTLSLTLLATLNNEGLENLILDKKAAYVFHFECPITGFRKVYETVNNSISVEIPSGNVRESIEICAFITAKQDIENYTNAKLHPAYDGIQIDLEKGSFLAIDNLPTITLDHARESLSSFIKFTYNEDAIYMSLKYALDKVTITLPKKDYDLYIALSDAMRNSAEIVAPMKKVLSSLTVLPAMIHILHEVQQWAPTVVERYSNESLWFAGFKRVLQENGCDLDNFAQFQEEERILELAQMLFESPISEAFDALGEITKSID